MKFIFTFFLFIYPFYSLSSLSKEKDNEVNNGYYLQLGVGYKTPKYMPLRYASPTYRDGVFGRDLKQNDGFEKDLGIGYRFNNKFRISINYKNYYQPAHDYIFYNPNFIGGTYVDNPKLKVDAYSINIFRDFIFKNSNFSPYIGAGIGFANTHNPDFGSIVRANGSTLTSSFKAHNSGSLYKEIMAGINYRINKKNTVFIQSAYSGVDDYVIMHSSGAERVQIQNPKTLTFLSGIRISF